MRQLLLTGDGYTSAHLALLGAHGYAVEHIPGDISKEQLHTILPTLSAYILGGSECLTDVELAIASRLRIISFVGTGYSSFIDAEAAGRRGIAIESTPGVNARAVAEHTLGLLLGMRRKLFSQNGAAKSGISADLQSSELSVATIGIVGMGPIAALVAQILVSGFGCRVNYWSRTRKLNVEVAVNIAYAPLADLLSSSDIVILLIPTTPETRGMFDEALLRKMQPSSMLVNTAGAALVQPAALHAALKNGWITCAGFDGYYEEPLPLPSADKWDLLSLPDHAFVVTPHTAARTAQSWTRMLEAAVNNVLCHARHPTA